MLPQVPTFVSEAVDGQLLLTLTDADLAGELNMRDRSREGLVEGDVHSQERQQVLGAIRALRKQNNAYRKQQQQQQQQEQQQQQQQPPPTSPSSSPSSSSSSSGVASPGQLERRLSLLPTDTERVDVLTQELLAMHAHHSALRQQHSTMSKQLAREKEHGTRMRAKHAEERQRFEQQLVEKAVQDTVLQERTAKQDTVSEGRLVVKDVVKDVVLVVMVVKDSTRNTSCNHVLTGVVVARRRTCRVEEVPDRSCSLLFSFPKSCHDEPPDTTGARPPGAPGAGRRGSPAETILPG